MDELSDLAQSHSNMTSAVPGKEMIPPCFLGLCLQDSSIDVLKFGFRGKESHLFLFSVADSAAV